MVVFRKGLKGLVLHTLMAFLTAQVVVVILMAFQTGSHRGIFRVFDPGALGNGSMACSAIPIDCIQMDLMGEMKMRFGLGNLPGLIGQ